MRVRGWVVEWHRVACIVLGNFFRPMSSKQGLIETRRQQDKVHWLSMG